MRSRIFKVMLAFLIVGFLSSGIFGDEAQKTVRGILAPIEWAGKTRVASVAIKVFSNLNSETSKRVACRDFIVADNEKGRELLDLGKIGKTVEAKGTVVRDKDDRLLIYVNEYKVIEEERLTKPTPDAQKYADKGRPRN